MEKEELAILDLVSCLRASVFFPMGCQCCRRREDVLMKPPPECHDAVQMEPSPSRPLYDSKNRPLDRATLRPIKRTYSDDFFVEALK